MKDVTANLPRMANKELAEYTDLGGYPLYYLAQDPEDGMGSDYTIEVCPKCAKEVEANKETTERITASEVNWEDEALMCEYCESKIECAYPSDKEG